MAENYMGIPYKVINGLDFIFSLVIAIPLLAVITRRLHDINQTGWWQLLYITGVGVFIVLIMCTLDPNDKDNRYDLWMTDDELDDLEKQYEMLKAEHQKANQEERIQKRKAFLQSEIKKMQGGSKK